MVVTTSCPVLTHQLFAHDYVFICWRYITWALNVVSLNILRISRLVYCSPTFLVVQVYKELERGRNLDYWNDITVIVEDELHKLRKLEKQSAYEAGMVADSFTVLFAFAALVQCNPYPSFLYAEFSCQSSSLVFSLEDRAWQEPEPSHVTGMALAHCILGKFLGVVCHCFPPPLDVPTLAARFLCPQRRERS